MPEGRENYNPRGSEVKNGPSVPGVPGLNPAPTHTNDVILGKFCLCLLFFSFFIHKVGIIIISISCDDHRG